METYKYTLHDGVSHTFQAAKEMDAIDYVIKLESLGRHVKTLHKVDGEKLTVVMEVTPKQHGALPPKAE